MSYDTSAIRQFLRKQFDDEEFEALCFDYFVDVQEDFSRGMSKGEKIQRLLDHCRRYNQMDSLMAALQRERTALYREQFAPVQPATPAAPRQRNSRQIFISHATADAAIAHRLAADLKAAGWAVWIAPDSIQPGEKWVEAINRGLEASGIFVLLLTPEAVASRWVTSETNVAIEMEHEGLVQFIPLQIRPCHTPALWRAYQRISFRNSYDAGWYALLVRLHPIPTPPTPPRIQVRQRPPEAEPPPGNSFVHEESGLEFVRIPAGEFLYGEKKQKIYLPVYWISKTPVTNAHYARFVTPTRYDAPAHWQKKTTYPDGLADHPVIYVSWHDAAAYCEWAGLDLPNEEQWEKAARGTDGREYPWGNEWREKHCNSREAVIGGTSRLGQFSPQGDSPFGCMDMSGNAWEWTNSWYDEMKIRRVVRGGSWSGSLNLARAASRSNIHPAARGSYIGFRVVGGAPFPIS